LLRLDDRWIVRDEGSSAGTRIDGAAVRFAFLNPGARLELGDVELVLELAPPAPLQQVGPDRYALDPVAFEGLVELRHPGVCAALVGFLGEAPPWIAGEAARLFPDDAARRDAFGRRVADLYSERANQARELLPALLGVDAGVDPAAWLDVLRARAGELPPQVTPVSWLG
jgi:hypothetical protein